MNELRFVNLTPHPITLIGELGDVTIQPEPVPARVETKTVQSRVLDTYNNTCPQAGYAFSATGFPVRRVEYGAITGLPDPQPGMVYIVSTVVAQAAKRPDVLYPDTGSDCERDERGQVRAVRALIEADDGSFVYSARAYAQAHPRPEPSPLDAISERTRGLVYRGEYWRGLDDGKAG